MSHPDARTREILERNAREFARATVAPPAELADDPAAYIVWLRDEREAAAETARRPNRGRPFVDRRSIPRNADRVAPRTAELAPEYAAAAERLSRLPDMGGASIEAARAQLGPDARYEDLVLHAAAHPVVPEGNGTPRNDTERPGTDAPACACGTALDPDGTCLTCATLANGPTT